jgi:spore coat protein U-like protein
VNLLPRLLILATLSVACGVSIPVLAATACTVTTTDVAFGSYSPFNNTSRESIGSVGVICTAQVGQTITYAIKLTSGSGSFAARQMASGASRLGYNLFTDSPRTLVWGDGTGGTSIVSDSYNVATSPTAHSYAVYGRILAGQTQARVGNYSDNITVTVTY